MRPALPLPGPDRRRRRPPAGRRFVVEETGGGWAWVASFEMVDRLDSAGRPCAGFNYTRLGAWLAGKWATRWW